MSNAALHGLRGEWGAMWRSHPFAPYFGLLFGLVAVAAVLPSGLRQRWVAAMLTLEARTRAHAVLLLGFAVFGVARWLWHIARPG
jgi:hypothetical protein